MHEALFYKVVKDTIRCELCPHMCLLKDNEVGKCKARVNKGGMLMTMAFGNPCTIHVDPIEKKPLYHFLPGTKTLSIATGGCNLSCKNCQNHSISQSSPIDVEIGKVTADAIVNLAISKNCSSIAYTYTEPTVCYEYMLDIAQLANFNGLRNVMVSSGYINKRPLEGLCKYIDAANIDLKCFDDSTYLYLSGIHLKPVLETLLVLKAHNVWLEVTCLIIPQYTDDFDMIDKMLEWLVSNDFVDTPIHFNRFFPSHRLKNITPTPVETLYNIANKAKQIGIKYVYVGNVEHSLFQDTICNECKELFLKRKKFEIKQDVSENTFCNSCGNQMPGIWC